MARELAERGAKLVLLARNQSKLSAVRDSLPRASEHHLLVPDLGNSVELSERLMNLVKEISPIEILVCNAGGPKAGPVLEADPESFMTAFRTHVVANQILVQKLVPFMKERGYGRIINIISTSVKIPIPNLGVSNTIRGAVASWAKTLANELGVYGITVNNVLPGYTATERLEVLKENTGKRLNQSVSAVEEMWKASIPLQRFADPRETAQAVAFLASPQASYISGVNLPVDGGRTGCL